MNESSLNGPDPVADFRAERESRLQHLARDVRFREQSRDWLEQSMRRKYTYNFDWLGRPIIQYPQEVIAIQELIWRVRPDLVIETGIAHGGSLVLSASMLALLDMCDAIEAGEVFDPRRSRRKVVGVDIDIRSHNRKAIESHPMSSRIRMVEGSSIAEDVVEKVRKEATGCEQILVCLDSLHTHDHVLAELEAYAPLVSLGSYCVVFDTFVEDVPADVFTDRPWGPSDNPRTAARQYLSSHREFEVDEAIEIKLQITGSPGGYLKRVA
jgi:cephalosporin hydroxylase